MSQSFLKMIESVKIDGKQYYKQENKTFKKEEEKKEMRGGVE